MNERSETDRKKEETVAVLLAAGASSRFNGSRAKQFELLCGEAVFMHSLRVLYACEDIGFIVLCLRQNDAYAFEYAKKLTNECFASTERIVLCEGGETRAESLYKSLCFLTDIKGVSQNAKVISHDAARPNLKSGMLYSCIEALKSAEAVSLGVKVSDTLCLLDDEGFQESFIDRDRAWRIQTPQCFTLGDYISGYEKLNENEKKSVTDAIGVLGKVGVKVKIIAGSEDNIKITRSADLTLCERLLSKKI